MLLLPCPHQTCPPLEHLVRLVPTSFACKHNPQVSFRSVAQRGNTASGHRGVPRVPPCNLWSLGSSHPGRCQTGLSPCILPAFCLQRLCCSRLSADSCFVPASLGPAQLPSSLLLRIRQPLPLPTPRRSARPDPALYRELGESESSSWSPQRGYLW